MKVLILGATGFIGSAITQALVNEGHQITGLGRNPQRAALKMPQVHWIAADLSQMTRPEDWRDVLDGQQVVINCAGALQDGLSDNLRATQETSMFALYETAHECGLQLIVQISADTQFSNTDLPFLKTKRNADTALAARGVPYCILRPAVVLGRNAHGGSALLRALAGLPFVIPLVYANRPVATVALDDVASTVSEAITGAIPPKSDIVLASAETLTLKQLVLLHRRWLGLPPAPVITLPAVLARPITWLADCAGKLGWRSPLRSTALAVISGGFTNKQPQTNGLNLSSAMETLAAHPSGVQDLWFARLYLLKPMIIGVLSLFWILSGIIPFFSFEAARSHFVTIMPVSIAGLLTVATCLTDIGLGLAVLCRPTAKRALIGMLCLTLVYLLGASLFEPYLWIDPLGALVKVLPSIFLTLTALAIFDER